MKNLFKKFKPAEAWLFFRVDVFVQSQPIDIYFMIDIASSYVFGQAMVEGDLPKESEIKDILKSASNLTHRWPKILYCVANDPAEALFRKISLERGIKFASAQEASVEFVLGPFKKEFSQTFFSPLGVAGSTENNGKPTIDQSLGKAFIPDSYNSCSCGSGSKYKFCCKPILKEITHAMVAAEEARFDEALKHMANATSIKGEETPEILCRYAIVYSFIDMDKARGYLDKCLIKAPNHPRAHYINGMDLREVGDFDGAIESYMIAVNNYPSSDTYHLNEVWNNLGTVYYDMGNYAKAKAAWEKAVLYLPEDEVAKGNLQEFIYQNQAIPEEIRGDVLLYEANT